MICWEQWAPTTTSGAHEYFKKNEHKQEKQPKIYFANQKVLFSKLYGAWEEEVSIRDCPHFGLNFSFSRAAWVG